MISCFLQVLYPIGLVKSKSLIFLFTFLLAFDTATSQQFNTRLYTTNDGLPTSAVFGVFEDRKGYLWIGGTNGISRFDGREFINFGPAEGLPSLHAWISLEDSKQRLWAATSTGMAVLKGSSFETFPIEDNLNIDYVFRVIETRTRQIWALTKKGVYRFDDTIWRKVKLFPGWENEACRDIAETDLGLYINYGRLIGFRNSTGNWYKLGQDHSQGHFFLDFKTVKEQLILFTQKGVSKIEGDHLEPLFEWEEGSANYAKFVDSYGRLWYCKQDFGIAFNVTSPGNWKKVEQRIPNKYGTISLITGDSHGSIWIGTQEGLLRLKEAPFSTTNENDMINGGSANSGFVLSDSAILFNTRNGYLICYPDKKDRNFYLKNFSEDIIDASATDEEGRTWFVTRLRRLFRMNDQKITDFSYLLDKYPTGSFDVCAYDKLKKRLFIASDNVLLVGNENKLEEFIPSNTRKPVINCHGVQTTRNGTIILFVKSLGMFLLDSNDNLRKWRNSGGYIMEDREGNIWASDAHSELVQYRVNQDGNFDELSKLTTKDGLQNYSVIRMGIDSLDRIWLLSPTGLDILKRNKDKNWEVFNFSKAWGLNLNWALANLIIDKKGDVWLTTFHDLIRFDSRKIQLTKEVPKVVIEKVQVNLKDVDWHDLTDSLWGYQQLPLNPRFSYAENTITIFFNGITYSASPKLEYSYQLNSGDSTWSLPFSNSSISFEDLRPGEYHFKVKTRDQASAWSLPAEFAFTIISPFWMRWWFITICILFLAGIVYSIYKYRINQLKKLLSIRTKISQDLHDELGSTLTSINILSRVSRSNLDKDKSRASALLEKITEQSENMQQSMSDIVWAIRPDNDKLENLAIRMREYLSQTADPKGLKVELLVEETILKENLPMQQRQNVFLIFKEAVNNAVKYSKCNKITVHLAKRDKNIILIIEDDGVGISQGIVSSSNGMKNMDSRARMLNGTLDIQSMPGTGTRIILQYPAT